jgi:hypothetical protein
MNKPSRDWLLVGSGHDDDIGELFSFLSGKPAAVSEVRDAIVRILHGSGWDTLGIGRNLISILFDPERRPEGSERPVWTVEFKRAGKGHPNEWQDSHIAMAVQARREFGKSYEKAIEETAENTGLSERQIGRIYSKYKGKFRRHDIR